MLVFEVKCSKWALAFCRTICLAAVCGLFGVSSADAKDTIAKGYIRALPFDQTTCSIRKDIKPRNIYASLRFSIVNLKNDFEITDESYIERIFDGLRKKFIGNNSGLFVVYAKVMDANDKVLSLFPIYQWDSETKTDGLKIGNTFQVIDFTRASDLSRIKLTFDIRYTEETESKVFQNAKRVLDLAVTAYSGGFGAGALALGASKLNNAQEYDEQLKLFLDRVENFNPRPVVIEPMSFHNQNCYVENTPAEGFDPYSDAGTSRPKAGISLVFSGEVQAVDQPIKASLKLQLRSSMMIDQPADFASAVFVKGNDKSAMLGEFKSQYSKILDLGSELEDTVRVANDDGTLGAAVAFENAILKTRTLHYRNRLNVLKQSEDKAALGPLCAELIRDIKSGPLSDWDQTLFFVAIFDRYDFLTKEVLEKCTQHNAEYITLTDRIKDLGLLEEPAKQTASTNLLSTIIPRTSSDGMFNTGRLANTYSVSAASMSKVVKVNTSFAAFNIPSDFHVEKFKEQLVEPGKTVVAAFHSSWPKELEKQNHPLFAHKKDDANYWKLDDSVDRLSGLQGVHSSFLTALMLQHIASSKTLSFACAEAGDIAADANSKYWTLEVFSESSGKPVSEITIRGFKPDTIKSGTCYFASKPNTEIAANN